MNYRYTWHHPVDRPSLAYENQEPPLPAPVGWFTVAFSADVDPGQVITRRLFDEDVVLYRTSRGTLHAVRPHCPHMGAHLGLARIKGEDIECRFHQFAFGPDGACVRTGYGTQAPKTGLRARWVQENHGIIFVWYDPGAAEPQWEAPQIPDAGFCPPAHTTHALPSHPQVVHENLFDAGHIGTLHGEKVQELRFTQLPAFDSPILDGAMTGRTYLPFSGKRLRITFNFRYQAYGLGVMFLEARFPLSLMVRQWVLPTPVGPWQVHLHTAVNVRTRFPSWLPRRMRRVLSTALSGLLARIMLWHGVRENILGDDGDVPIWATQAYQPHPRLAQGDGPIIRYRRWAATFYPPTAPSEQHVAEAGRGSAMTAPAEHAEQMLAIDQKDPLEKAE
ncbi:Rieske 2Fe-2S domain-containing protein [Streptomyces sp. SID8366]|uniref:aromatic ring-hydroxylating oxygenase subunit alpha n=1 Tax=unclassified Streptomyces TaxID=2593676 RepID=UPI000DC4A10C|nr:Rieske 2Fe-2S domain-containing protein [Streptomyces sp. PsTaAH-130]MYU06080.1 Rieske 2Fe-2S domain-containing protein [Streptomyces sp. SID8366]MYU68040.1 Rieske 2Fe-2S domain-containing protein [Streptomyces sp. SID69]RAJ64148.1 phenylpropionate dioxygenase-like ring-hydroxylating dioxygenase large terminal subunit [Streptomyces sp. PsTaAH-130]